MKKEKVRKSFCLYIVFWVMLCLLWTNKAEAANGTEKTGEDNPDLSMLDEVDFSQLDEVLDSQKLHSDFNFRKLVEKLISGEDIDKKWLLEEGKKALFSELSQSKGYLTQIILLVVAFALLYNFSNVFENAAVTDISFYMVYMILLALLMKSFLVMSQILTDALGVVLDFMQALLPAFCLTVMFSTGTATSIGVYQLTLFLIYIIEAVLIYGIIPAIHIYILLELLNHFTKEEMISKMTELIKSGVEWTLKILLTIVVGINVVQGMLTPVIDGFRTSIFARTAGMIPGIGNSVRGVAEIMVGSGIIIKNGVGVAGILVILALCAGPMIKVGVLALLYKLSAAVIQPVADKRLAGCISGMGVGAGLFGKVLITANVMLLVTLALITAATTWNR